MRRWSAVGLGALLVADLVLIALVLRPAPADEGALRVVVASPNPSASNSSASTSSVPPATANEAVPLTVLVVAVSPDVAWRARSSVCTNDAIPNANDAAVEVSDDGGQSWTSTGFADPVVVRLRPADARKAFAIAAEPGDGCAGEYRSTLDAKVWWGSGDAASAWYRSPSDTRQVHAPTDDMVRPCADDGEAIDLAVRSSTEAAVLCGDQTVALARGPTATGSWSPSMIRSAPASRCLRSS